jgi:sugar phosphate isomerase/epimerase
MNMKYTLPGIAKLGGTSFLLADDYVPACRFAASCCQDIALLTMETGVHGEKLLPVSDVKEIAAICADNGTSLHVHLPTDAHFGTPDTTRKMVNEIAMVVERTTPIQPHSFVLHITDALTSSPGTMKTSADITEEQNQWVKEALQKIAAMLPAPEMLCIENIENFSPDYWDGWIENSPYSRCIDIGHLWKNHHDPVPYIRQWLPRTTIIHLHGLMPRKATAHTHYPFGSDPRDHKSLRMMPSELIDAVMQVLWQEKYTGILTLEVFSFADFTESHTILVEAWERYQNSMPLMA